MAFAFDITPVIVCVGHYGVGKTNTTLNLVRDLAREGFAPTLVDLDVVNPYFRSSEYRTMLEESGVALVAPVFAEAGSSLDVPSLTGAIIPSIEAAYVAWHNAGISALSPDAQGTQTQSLPVVVLDVGGDDAGATALGRFAHTIEQGPYAMIYVVNPYRNLTSDIHQAAEVFHEIEAKSRLRISGLVSNAHLKEYTVWETIEEGIAFASKLSEFVGVPLLCATAPKNLLQQENGGIHKVDAACDLYPVEQLVKTPWE